MTFFDSVAVNIYSSAILQGMTSAFFMFVYLTTLSQICKFHIVE